MAGKFNLTFTLGKGTQPSAAAPIPTVTPELRSHDLFPTRIWQAQLDPLVPYLDRWVTDVLAMRYAHELADTADISHVPYWVIFYARGRGPIRSSSGA